jgi:hypothetical protein
MGIVGTLGNKESVIVESPFRKDKLFYTKFEVPKNSRRLVEVT